MIEHRAWTCRPYRPGDEVHLAPLFEQVFERTMTPGSWRWKLGHCTGAVANSWLAVDSRDRPVCHYGGIPRRVRLAAGERNVMVAVDAMTAPEFRRQGAYTAVVTRAHEAWRDAGVAFVLGMPNEQHGSRIVALGWQHVASLRWMIRPLRPDTLLARRFRLARLSGLGTAGKLWNRLWDTGRRPSGVVLNSADRAESEAAFAHMAAAPASQGRLMLNRDKAWMVHRLLAPPESPYEIVVAADDEGVLGYAACRLREVDDRKIGAIAELATPTGDDRIGAALISAAANRLRRQGAEIAIALAVPGSRDERLFRRRGFLFSWGEFAVHAVVLDPDLDPETLSGSERWRLAGGDFDLI